MNAVFRNSAHDATETSIPVFWVSKRLSVFIVPSGAVSHEEAFADFDNRRVAVVPFVKISPCRRKYGTPKFRVHARIPSVISCPNFPSSFKFSAAGKEDGITAFEAFNVSVAVLNCPTEEPCLEGEMRVIRVVQDMELIHVPKAP
jgi:hypothetical protein